MGTLAALVPAISALLIAIFVKEKLTSKAIQRRDILSREVVVIIISITISITDAID